MDFGLKMEPKIEDALRRRSAWFRLRPKIAPRWLPDLICHASGAFSVLFGAYFEGFGLDFGSFNLQKMPKTC